MTVLYLASAQHEATIRIEGGNKDREKELQIRKEVRKYGDYLALGLCGA